MITGKPFDVEIVTSERIVFEGKVDSVTVPGTKGQFQMLIDHTAIVSQLDIGAIKMTDAHGKNMTFATSGGFVQMLKNKASIVVETAEDASSIDIKRSLEAKRRAEERLAKHEHFDVKRAEISLLKALNRLNVSDYRG